MTGADLMNPAEHDTHVNPETESEREKSRSSNLDPLTAQPGAQIIGTGLGAAFGGMAGAIAGLAASATSGAAVGTMLGGPVGGTIGLVAGAVAGGLLGHAAGEALNPTEEDHHWSSSYTREPYYNSDYAYDDYLPAYRTGAEGHDANPGKTFAEIEAQLQEDYISNRGRSRLSWLQARAPMLAAWERRRQYCAA